ncbi:deleted in malignant brain tumors 1 protein isoform X1 [Oreochromis niloticus]|uniref:deleted in malignant brain tumors 1 protein isoform X1 n=1 Tax=Oreochromis niloticus TaxID=8128 RepID=UPI0009057546|nr:deleted in malignant brain tumors 1 protein isoform X1 [Oreochromis niloticus]XP_019201396.1 deleted in malignant brain tumors 1 protein isoform X1 [Oreochromis niloticus]XP_019201397.1 deleted in malignant brain tumors 1 protein isoform X1 [Oreochromis niloticus]CAI5683597.1 unnamed protein product [Mustela putorius furo]
MILISDEKRHFVFYLSLGLLSFLQFTECEKIRLVGPSRCSGRVEIFYQDSWGTVCDDQWSIANAEVVCRELSCGTAMEAKKGAFFGQGKDEIWLDDVQCVGHESSILKCQHRPFGQNNCGHSEDAGVVCSEHVRFTNGTTRCNGRAEVYNEGQWKKVCNDWGKEAAQVVCREAGCGDPLAQTETPYFGEARDLTAVKTICSGNETSVSQCSVLKVNESCDDATVVCGNSQPIRLVNGTNRCSGRVEIYYSSQWGTVCDDRWGMQEATVACREMNCGNALAVKYKAYFGRGQEQVWLDDIECTGHEMSLAQCPHRGFGEHDCDHSEDAGLVCSETVRLINGTDGCSGRLEVFHDGRWGKVCNNNWGLKEATVVCKELNCGVPVKSQNNVFFGDSSLRGFTSRCTGNVSSISQCQLQEHMGSCAGVSLACAGQPPLRLVNGTDRCSGRVEILHDGQWGTVCDDEWDFRDAEVVCRAMDCGTPQTAKSSAFFGEGQGMIWLDDVNCLGNETSLVHCRRPSFGENNCGHGEDAGVICSATIRLINGTDTCSGRVEVHRGDHWSPAFNVNWGRNEATVVCREMNCGDPVKMSGSFGQGGDLRGYEIHCNGRETSLTQCSFRDYSRSATNRVEEASVVCSGNVRLTGGSTRCDGRVEYFDKKQWGTVCAESWDMNDATVVCKQLDCGRPHKLTQLGPGTGQTWTDQIECNGRESTLTQCPQRPYPDRTCNNTVVAGVSCTGSLAIRVANSNDECSGRVEVRHGEQWHTVCDTDWTLSKAQVVCEALECGRAMNAPGAAFYGPGSGPVVEASSSCFDNVTSLQQCSSKGFTRATCGHEHDAGVLCAAQVRLMGGSGECSGRVEVFYKGQWGTVCDDDWEMSDADVVCRQLGCGHAVSAPTSAHFGRGTGPIWLDNVECSGQESALSHCSHPGFGENNCGHGEDASVICLGALQKPEITINPGVEVNWGDKVEITCTLVTEHMGGTFLLKKTQGSFQMEKFSDQASATFVFPKVDFSQKGSYYCEYQKKMASQIIYYPQGIPADLSVVVKLEKPSISLVSPHAMVIYSPDTVSVTQGSTFSVTCSIHSIYSKGFFSLTNLNTNNTKTMTGFGYSVLYLATFELPSVDIKDQGSYTCRYSVNVSAMSFSSAPSRTLYISVTSTSSSSVVAAVVGVLVLLLLLVVVIFLVWRRKWGVSEVIVQFSNRFGAAIKQEMEDKTTVALDERERNNQLYEPCTPSPEQSKTDADTDSNAERAPEDLAGKVCYELEPLVVS